ncbi:DNA-3-methyladenine glycosylase I [Thioalkalivibrio sp. HK1]|uniref:DNA-3-methyladenine glycosylase I n=1 Tax=Thioalkalivibrio sp. HK1 TaxID=1469245 RepID=UPI000571F4EE|nr:DNA-3-methyladenine glycosylase I [Thioalkalivibrio sp. HK1]
MATIRKPRCPWAMNDPLNIAYHDEEWGVPQRDDTRLFEMLTLEGAQAGLSWLTILKKREGYRKAFAQFDIERIAHFKARECRSLMANPSIVRHRLKIASTITNAKAVLDLEKKGISFGQYLWSFAPESPSPAYRRMEDVPSTSEASSAMSRAMKRDGFRFCGPTICHSLMQAAGMVNDHLKGCFRHRELSASKGP